MTESEYDKKCIELKLKECLPMVEDNILAASILVLAWETRELRRATLSR